MKKSIFLIVLLTAALILSACGVSIDINNPRSIIGSGNVVTQDIPVSGFNVVKMNSIGSLSIRQGDTESLTIEAEDNILPLLQANVSGGQLVMDIQPNASIQSKQGIHYTLVVKDLTRLEMAGMGDIDIDGLATNSLDMDLSGSGDLTLKNLQAQDLSLSQNGMGSAEVTGQVKSLTLVLKGSGDLTVTGLQFEDANISLEGMGSIELSGQANSLALAIKGSGDVQAADLSVKDATVSISGMGNVKLTVVDRLDATISGSGRLEYYGSPKITQNVTGMGSIENLGTR